jgi:glycosyltransferase 2 family protein
MRKAFGILLRWGIPFAIIAWLVVSAVQNDSFVRLRDAPKHWDLLGLAAILCFAAVLLTMVRWYFLVRALEIPFRLRDSIRLGFLGYLFNFVTPGSVGGDFFKAVFLAQGNRGRRAEAAVTVVVDRLIGLYALFLVSTAAILSSHMWQLDSKEIRVICQATFWCTGVGTALFVVASLPWVSRGPFARWLMRLPRVGPIVEQINRAKRMYNDRWPALVGAVLLSVVVQSLFSIAIWLIAHGLLSQAPSLAAHFVVVPLALSTGALPLAPNALGTFEFTLEFLYRQVPGGVAIAASDGFLVALGYRLMTVLIALIGVVIYLVDRREKSPILYNVPAGEDADATESVQPLAVS